MIRRLAVTTLALLLLLAGIDWLAGALLARSPDWRHGADPRQRILSDHPNQGSTVVLIGDSVFYSTFIDREDQALWRQLEVRLGTRVMPAALNGASPSDMLAIARRVARLWPAKTIALVGIQPVRLFGPNHPEIVPGGVYAQRFRRLGDGEAPHAGDWRIALDERLAAAVEQRSFLLRNREAILLFVESRLKRAQRQVVEQQHDAVWTSDDGSGLARWRNLEGMLARGGGEREVPFSWVTGMNEALRASGIRPLFVLTPLNLEMLRRYGRLEVPSERMLAESHDYLVRQLEARGYEFIDLQSGLPSDCFADAVHPNVKGNVRIADAIASWLAARPRMER